MGQLYFLYTEVAYQFGIALLYIQEYSNICSSNVCRCTWLHFDKDLKHTHQHLKFILIIIVIIIIVIKIACNPSG